MRFQIGFIVYLILIFIFSGCTQESRISGKSHILDTTVISSESCGKAECTLLGVTCKDIPERQVLVRSLTHPKEKGKIIFTTGGYGGTLFSKVSENTQEIVRQVLLDGFSVYEVAWMDKKGWSTNSEGKGFSDAMCGYAEVVKWITKDNPNPVCAYGNSGGSAQIAYALSVYGLSDTFDMVVLSGGPPGIHELGCFGSDDPELDKAKIPIGALYREAIDYLMGWDEQYCQNDIKSDERIKLLKDTSLVTDTQPRIYNFPNTKVNFVNSISDPINAQHQSRIYFDKISSEKSWYDIQEQGHDIFNIEEGKTIIINLLTKECK